MIFARRSIQRFINKLSETLPRAPVKKIVDNLNRNDQTSLYFEWEAAVLFALGEFGAIDYEASYGGARFADVTFRLPDQEKICFVADITTVSDRGLEDENPIEDLLKFLHEKATSLELPGGFQYRVEGEQIGKRLGNRKAKLLIPSKGELRSYLEEHITPCLRKIREDELEVAEIPIPDPYKLSITYRKDAFGSSGSYLSYTTAYSLTRNPISRRLRKKRKQLSESGFEGSMGVFLCDGSCDLFRTSPNAGTSAYSKHEVIEDFLRQNTSIAFVAAIWVEQPYRGVFDPPKGHCLHFELFQNPAARFQLSDEVARSLERIPDILPIPVNTAPSKARAFTPSHGIGNSHYGRSQVNFEVGSTVVRISSRALLSLLAGKTAPHNFSEDHWPSRIGPSDDVNNPFGKAVERSMMIEQVSVERNADEDDDWITLRLSPADAATMPFYVP